MTKKSIATVSQEECVALQGPLDGRSTQSLHSLIFTRRTHFIMTVNGKNKLLKSDKYSV